MLKILKLSVHGLVDYLLRKGDIDNRIYNKSTMAEGSRIHALYQSKQSDNYLSEHFLSETFTVDDFNVTLEGRADGIILQKNGAIIDEIKSTIDDLQNFHNDQEEWHLGQAKCYALMYAHETHLDKVGVRLTYISQTTNEKKIFNYTYTTQELEEYVLNLIHRYLNFYKYIFTRTEKRNQSAKELKFPYTNLRLNQKQLSKYTYSIAKNGGILFVEAPTGIGKTISTLFPYVKSFALEQNDKIFYLTAKNSGKESAYKAVEDMKKAGLNASEIIITAKDKMCFNPGAACNPDECPFCKDYYTKIGSVIQTSIENESTFNLYNISNIAYANKICPFELQLDLSLFMDIIICDYNYMFDPIAHMQRYFDEDCSKYIALIDEAHNLVERGRDMYSGFIDLEQYKVIKKQLVHFEHKQLKNAFTRINKLIKKYEELNDGETIFASLESTEYNSFDALLVAMQDVNKNFHDKVSPEFLSFYLELNKFLKLYEYLDNTYVLYLEKYNKNTLKINFRCLDASKKLQSTLSQIRSKVLFSATLSPIEYYVNMLGGNISDPVLVLNSPFKKDNLEVVVMPTISTRYKNRGNTYEKIADSISAFVKNKIGNYFVFVPSYEYLRNIMSYIHIDANIIVQEKDMDDVTKEAFLSNFVRNPDKTTIGFVIVGGSFGEGIDLVDDRLIGVVVIGVGLPQICFERNAIKDYFNSKSGNGFEYSYVNPGINRILQAIGRIIRSETDKGAALLIDDRYLSSTYNFLFENRFSNYKVATSTKDIEEIVSEFWGK